MVGSRRDIEKKLSEIGVSPRQPYKVIAYMKDLNDRTKVEESYSSFLPKFDSDLIEQRQKQFRALFLSLFGVGIIFGGIILILLVLLFLGYFREKEPLFRLAHVYGIASPYKQVLLFAESTLFLIFGTIISILVIVFFQNFIFSYLSRFFHEHGVLFPLVSLSSFEIFLLISFSTIILM